MKISDGAVEAALSRIPEDDWLSRTTVRTMIEAAAPALLAPLKIVTIEQLDTLQDGMIILAGNIAYAHHDGEFHGTDGSRVDSELIPLPATVVYEPEV